MIGADDIDGFAAEYVLGTLDANERASVADRRGRDSRLDTAIASWERRLGPLTALVSEIAPPAALYQHIEGRLGAGQVGDTTAQIVRLHRRVSAWRSAALAASAIAATLAVFVGVREYAPRPGPKSALIAVLQKDAAAPAFLLSVDEASGAITVRPVAAKAETGKSYELWLVHDSLGGPKSLGLVDEPGPMVKPVLSSFTPEVLEQGTFAVSQEPAGGSTTGAPTGPVLFAGKLISTNR